MNKSKASSSRSQRSISWPMSGGISQEEISASKGWRFESGIARPQAAFRSKNAEFALGEFPFGGTDLFPGWKQPVLCEFGFDPTQFTLKNQ
jgi:hypothetical protein